jgi:hypothetical protein
MRTTILTNDPETGIPLERRGWSPHRDPASLPRELRAELIRHWLGRERALGPISYECPPGLEDLPEHLLTETMQRLYYEVCCRLRDLLEHSKLVARCIKGGRVEREDRVPRSTGWTYRVPVYTEPFSTDEHDFPLPLSTLIHRYEWNGRREYDPATDTEVREYVYRGLER